MTLTQTRRLVLSPRVISVMSLPKGWTYTCFQLCKLLEPEKSSLISTATRVENGKRNFSLLYQESCTILYQTCFVYFIYFFQKCCTRHFLNENHDENACQQPFSHDRDADELKLDPWQQKLWRMLSCCSRDATKMLAADNHPDVYLPVRSVCQNVNDECRLIATVSVFVSVWDQCNAHSPLLQPHTIFVFHRRGEDRSVPNR